MSIREFFNAILDHEFDGSILLSVFWFFVYGIKIGIPVYGAAMTYFVFVYNRKDSFRSFRDTSQSHYQRFEEIYGLLPFYFLSLIIYITWDKWPV